MEATTGETSPAKTMVFHSLQAGRGIAALMVVFYHCEGLFSLSKYWRVTGHYFFFGSSGVDFFFVLSGIVILHAHLPDLGRAARLKAYAWKRFRRIYPLYWFVLLAMLPLYFLRPSLGNGFEREPAVIMDSLLLLPISRIETIIPVSWTLDHEIMFYLVFGILLLNKRWGIWILSLWMLGSVAVTVLPMSNHPLVNFYLSPLHLLFGLGLLVRVAWQRLSRSGAPLAVGGALGFAGCCLFVDLVRPTGWALPLACGFCAATAALGLMLMEKRSPIAIPAFLRVLGDASYSLYLIHYAVLSAAAKVIYPIWMRHPTALAVPYTLMILIAVAAGFTLHLCLERPLLRVLSRRREVRLHGKAEAG